MSLRTLQATEMSYTISIPTYEDKDGYIAYIIKVKSVPSEGAWSFHRRYSVLRESYEQLRKAVKTVLPNFPPKKFFGNKQETFLQVRRAALEQVYRTIAALPEVRENAVFKSFVHPKDLSIEEPPQLPPHSAPAPVSEAHQTRPAVQLTRELESIMNRIVDGTINQFINLADLPTPLEAEDVRRKQKEYVRLTAGIRLEWKTQICRGDASGSSAVLSAKAKKWKDDKIRELQMVLDETQVPPCEAVVTVT